MRCHLVPVKISCKKTRNNKCWQGCGEVGTRMHYCWDCTLVQPLWKIVWKMLPKLKVELPYDLAIPLMGIYQKKMKILILTDICSSILIAPLFTVPKIQKQLVSIDGWMNKRDVVYIRVYNVILFSNKKTKTLAFVIMWMGLDGIMLSEISQREKGKYCMISYVE